jgi:hypothetical protein
MNSWDDLYKFLYNKLVDISNSEVGTIHYLIGPKWKVCNYNDTVKIANDTLICLKNEIKNLKEIDGDYNFKEKIKLIINVLIEISNAKLHRWEDGLFSYAEYYHAKDTKFKAKKCLKCLNEYI